MHNSEKIDFIQKVMGSQEVTDINADLVIQYLKELPTESAYILLRDLMLNLNYAWSKKIESEIDLLLKIASYKEITVEEYE